MEKNIAFTDVPSLTPYQNKILQSGIKNNQLRIKTEEQKHIYKLFVEYITNQQDFSKQTSK